MSKEKIAMLLLEAVLKEVGVATLDELIIWCMRKGINVSTQFISDVYYNYQFKHRKQIEYKPLDNPNIKVVPAKDVKLNHNNTYC